MNLFLQLGCLWARDQDEGLQGDAIWMGMSKGMNEEMKVKVKVLETNTEK